MSILILTLAFLAVWHFVYESIIAPCQRMKQRNKLFELRDKLRNVYIDGINEDDKQAFEVCQSGINNLLYTLPYISVASQLKLERMKEHDKELAERIDKAVSSVENCKNEEIIKIFNESANVIKDVLFINLGGWMIYLIPIVILVAISLVCYEKVAKAAKDILVTPDSELDNILPVVQNI